jgi:hypothetical protein
MVYDPFDLSNKVQFVVYGANGDRATTAQLDSTGKHVSVPNNCLACHGIGAIYNPNTNSVFGAQFLPFDVFSFRYSAQAGYTYAAQAEQLRQLNALVKQTNPVAGIEQFIEGLYLGNDTQPGASAVDVYVPPAWLNEPSHRLDGIALYRGVVKPGCRTCHMSSDNPDLDFLQYSDFTNPVTQGQIAADVCQTRDMPHAEHVLKRFWNSAARAYLVAGLDIDLNTHPCTP